MLLDTGVTSNQGHPDAGAGRAGPAGSARAGGAGAGGRGRRGTGGRRRVAGQGPSAGLEDHRYAVESERVHQPGEHAGGVLLGLGR